MVRKKAKATPKKPQVPFAYKLVLNQWLLSLFNVQRFEELAEHLRDEGLEGWTRTTSTASTTRSRHSSST